MRATVRTSIRHRPCWICSPSEETQGRLDNLHIAMVGDLKYGRTVHSLTRALAKFSGNRFYFIAPDALAMPQYILDMLDEKGMAGACMGLLKRSWPTSTSSI